MPDPIVYSTEHGRISICSTCGQSSQQCRCGQPVAPAKKSDGILRVMRDRKQRGGKTVTVICGIDGESETIAALAQQLKRHCGSGGTVKEGNIEIQGDHCDKVITKLLALGYKAKRAGG